MGDHVHDMQAARTAGVISVCATWFLEPEAVNSIAEGKPDHMVAQPSELFAVVTRIIRQIWMSIITRSEPGFISHSAPGNLSVGE